MNIPISIMGDLMSVFKGRAMNPDLQHEMRRYLLSYLADEIHDVTVSLDYDRHSFNVDFEFESDQQEMWFNLKYL